VQLVGVLWRPSLQGEGEQVETCPRCEAELPYEGDDYRDHDGCPFVACDDRDCRATKDGEGRLEVEHWRDHGYLRGCSHAC
jgi:hypothetical protein